MRAIDEAAVIGRHLAARRWTAARAALDQAIIRLATQRVPEEYLTPVHDALDELLANCMVRHDMPTLADVLYLSPSELDGLQHIGVRRRRAIHSQISAWVGEDLLVDKLEANAQKRLARAGIFSWQQLSILTKEQWEDLLPSASQRRAVRLASREQKEGKGRIITAAGSVA